MPVHDVAPYVEAAVRSVLGQEGVHLTLVVVDDGSTDGTWEIVSRLAQQCDNLIVARQAHAGQGAARNRGLELCRGTYLAFADGDDVVPPGSYAAMVGSLEATGSDLCLGGVRRVEAGRTLEPSWSREVHATTRLGVTLEEYLPAIKDILACNRVLRRDFWDRTGTRFPEGVVYEDHWPMLTTLVRARSVDILSRPVYLWQARPDGSSTGERKHELQNLLDRLAVKDDAWTRLEDAPGAVREAWLGRVLDVDLPPFVAQAARGDDEEYREHLRDALVRYTAQAGPGVWAFVKAQNRVRSVLGAAGRWDEVRALGERLAAPGLRASTCLEDGEVRLRADLFDAGSGVGADLRVLPPWQSALAPVVRRTGRSRRAGGSVVVRGVVGIVGFRLGDVPLDQVRGWLQVGEERARDVPVEFSARRTRRRFRLVADRAHLSFAATVPVALPTTPGTGVVPVLHVEVGQVRRSAPLRPVAGRRRVGLRASAQDVDGYLVLTARSGPTAGSPR